MNIFKIVFSVVYACSVAGLNASTTHTKVTFDNKTSEVVNVELQYKNPDKHKVTDTFSIDPNGSFTDLLPMALGRSGALSFLPILSEIIYINVSSKEDPTGDRENYYVLKPSSGQYEITKKGKRLKLKKLKEEED